MADDKGDNLKQENNDCPPKEVVDDDELDALLDDALSDFVKPPPKPKKVEKKTEQHDQGSDLGNFLDDDALLKMSEGWNEVLQQMSSEDPGLMEEFDSFQKQFPMGGAMGGFPGTAPEGANFDEHMKNALKDLTNNFNDLNMEGQDFGADFGGDFSEMMKEMQASMETQQGQGGAEGDTIFPEGDAFMGMMQGMMENLLTKDLLYPSLSEIKERYPSWLSENKEKLTPEDYLKYKSQNDIVVQLCDLFEQEADTDTEQTKKERTSKVVELMQKMQVFGQPPADMMAGISDSNQIPPMPQQCSVM
ncbi:peroxisomal biogenesis factor 19-like [Clytia hemisphaerica]|uniref:Peroxin-19 n=1 Tax=Clytia hemisphaerica TaxID=252671 RepID=A0A7M5WV43_9CNID|eukprot:TCONS_00007358-protein